MVHPRNPVGTVRNQDGNVVMAATLPDLFTLEAAVLRIIAECKPRITRPHDVTRIEIDRDGIVVHLVERDHDGYPIHNKTLGTYGEIVRRQHVPVRILEDYET